MQTFTSQKSYSFYILNCFDIRLLMVDTREIVFSAGYIKAEGYISERKGVVACFYATLQGASLIIV